MPVSQKYNMNIGKAYEGMVYGLRTAMVIRTVEADQTDSKALEFGGAVTAKADTVRGIDAIGAVSTSTEACYGILVRQVNHEALHRPSLDGKMYIKKGSVLGMMVEGEIMVKLEEAVARDQHVYFDQSKGTWMKATASKGYVNVVALQGGAKDDVVPVRIFSVAKSPAGTNAAALKA